MSAINQSKFKAITCERDRKCACSRKDLQVLTLIGFFLKQKELHHWVYGKHEYYSLSTHHRWVLVQIALHWLWVRGVLRGNITTVYKPDVQFPLSYLRDNNKTKRKTVSNRLSVNSLQLRDHLHDVFKRPGRWWPLKDWEFFPQHLSAANLCSFHSVHPASVDQVGVFLGQLRSWPSTIKGRFIFKYISRAKTKTKGSWPLPKTQ